ncbi:MAG: hypothetical protein ACI4HK_08730 [Ruminococcus sp.]
MTDNFTILSLLIEIVNKIVHGFSTLFLKKKEKIEEQSPQMCIFHDDKYLGNYPMYEVTLEVKANEELRESTKLCVKKIENSHIDLSLKYIISIVGKSDCPGQIRHLVYERYGEIPFFYKEEFILVDGNGFALVFDIKDKPQSILVTFMDNQVIYNIEQAKGNIIFPKFRYSFLK